MARKEPRRPDGPRHPWTWESTLKSIYGSKYVPTTDDLIIERHYAYVQRLDELPAARQHEDAIAMVTFADQVADAMIRDADFRKEDARRKGIKPDMRGLPRHPGFDRLAIDAERDNSYAAAIAICKEAQRQGWNGDWKKRIERCEAKLIKQRRGSEKLCLL